MQLSDAASDALWYEVKGMMDDAQEDPESVQPLSSDDEEGYVDRLMEGRTTRFGSKQRTSASMPAPGIERRLSIPVTGGSAFTQRTLSVFDALCPDAVKDPTTGGGPWVGERIGPAFDNQCRGHQLAEPITPLATADDGEGDDGTGNDAEEGEDGEEEDDDQAYRDYEEEDEGEEQDPKEWSRHTATWSADVSDSSDGEDDSIRAHPDHGSTSSVIASAASTGRKVSEAISAFGGASDLDELDDGVANDGMANDGMANDGMADDGMTEDAMAGDGVADDAANGATVVLLRRHVANGATTATTTATTAVTTAPKKRRAQSEPSEISELPLAEALSLGEALHAARPSRGQLPTEVCTGSAGHGTAYDEWETAAGAVAAPASSILSGGCAADRAGVPKPAKRVRFLDSHGGTAQALPEALPPPPPVAGALAATTGVLSESTASDRPGHTPGRSPDRPGYTRYTLDGVMNHNESANAAGLHELLTILGVTQGGGGRDGDGDQDMGGTSTGAGGVGTSIDAVEAAGTARRRVKAPWRRGL